MSEAPTDNYIDLLVGGIRIDFPPFKKQSDPDNNSPASSNEEGGDRDAEEEQEPSNESDDDGNYILILGSNASNHKFLDGPSGDGDPVTDHVFYTTVESPDERRAPKYALWDMAKPLKENQTERDGEEVKFKGTDVLPGEISEKHLTFIEEADDNKSQASVSFQEQLEKAVRNSLSFPDDTPIEISLFEPPPTFDGGENDEVEPKNHTDMSDVQKEILERIRGTAEIKKNDAIRLRIPLEKEKESPEEQEANEAIAFDLFSHTNLFFETHKNFTVYHSELPTKRSEVFGVGNQIKRDLESVTPANTNERGIRIHVNDDGYTGLYNLQFDLDALEPDELDQLPSGPITDLTQLRLCTWPRKLDTDQANRIIDEMFDRHFEHVLKKKHAAGQAPLSLGSRDDPDTLQQMLLLEHLWEDVRDDYEEVAWRPHRRLVTEHPQKNIMDVQDPAYDKMTETLQDPNAVMLRKNRDGSGRPAGHVPLDENTSLTFRQLVDRKSRIDYDTYPNQFVKQTLRIVRSICRHAIQKIERPATRDADDGANEVSSHLRHAAERIRREVDRWRDKPFWEDVSDLKTRMNTNNHTLMKDDRYSQILEFYHQLMSDLQLPDEVEDMLTNPLHEMHQVYEYWCWFQIGDLIGSMQGWNETSQDTVNLDEENGDAVRTFSKEDEQKEIEVRYELTAKTDDQTDEPYRSWSKPYRPDISVIIKQEDRVQNVLIFDAKYKATLSDDDGEDEWKGEDIDKMHAYRDAIRLSEDDDKQPRWFIALYPGDKIRLYSHSFGELEWKQKSLQKIEGLDALVSGDKCRLAELMIKGGVGALPLFPVKNLTDPLASILKQFVQKILERS